MNAPDFLINGSYINVSNSEIKGYNREDAITQTRKIYNTTLNLFKNMTLRGCYNN